MCLSRVKQKVPKVATKDVVCYKLLYKTPEGKYITPFEKVEVPLNELILSSLDNKNSSDIVHEGIHTFGKLKETKAESKLDWYYSLNNGTHNTYPDAKIVIVKALIPKDSLYWKGAFCTSINYNTEWFLSYCSNQIIYLKEVN
jgi:hypothetical protein